MIYGKLFGCVQKPSMLVKLPSLALRDYIWPMRRSLMSLGSILVDLWEDQIALVKPGNVYRLTQLQVRISAGEKKLTSTWESLFTSIADENLQNVRISQGDVRSDVIKAITVPCIDFVRRVEVSTQCRNCSRKLLQATASKTARCDRCGSRMRLSDCKKTNVRRHCCERIRR